MSKQLSISIEFVMPMTTVRRGNTPIYHGDLVIKAEVNPDQSFGIRSVQFDGANIIPVLDYFERMVQLPLHQSIIDATKNHIEYLQEQKLAS